MPADAKVPETSKASATPPRKRTAAQRRANRKERAARKGGLSRKVAVAASRKRGKGGRKKAAEHTCAMAGRRVSVPGWYIVRRGDSLWKIAARHYGKGRHYPVIFRANARRIANPNLIFRRQRIYLPKFRRRI
jgi:nucleoid-associated protein YgaU